MGCRMVGDPVNRRLGILRRNLMKKIILASIAATVFAGAALAGAHGSMSDKRVASMKEIGGAMKAISDVAKGNAEASDATVAAAMKINALAAKVPSWFPEGSGEYRAKANIWTCLLYTSDAADDLLCVDLCGRRISKKKNVHAGREE
eukprot:TRINITY_DN21711_c0_g1_i1.p3 TRINITY_DN21711_c0_g1~~TRINITY_DN21711_c0_g1_i1.p3  ORF type:complete len:147 (+),score=52.81 TRINITY_DN21711_c0_g1_i1:192-632(+)